MPQEMEGIGLGGLNKNMECSMNDGLTQTRRRLPPGTALKYQWEGFLAFTDLSCTKGKDIGSFAK